MLASLVLLAFDRTFLSNVLMIQAWGLLGADGLLNRRYKEEQSNDVVTSLNL
jgi:hypothetical protein